MSATPEPQRRVLRYEVPVDDKPHALPISLWAPITGVATRSPDVVEFWAVDLGLDEGPRWFTVVGTGQPFPPGWTLVRTAPRHYQSGLVWHLLDRKTDPVTDN